MTTRTQHANQGETLRTPRGRLLLASVLAMSTATAANLGLYAAVGYFIPEVAAWPGTGPVQIAGATVIYLLVAALVFAAVRRFSSRAARHYVIIATISLLFSLGPPLSLGFGPGLPGVPPAEPAIAITLGLMHVISYAISVPMFLRMALD